MTTDHALALIGGILGGALVALTARHLDHALTRHLERTP